MEEEENEKEGDINLNEGKYRWPSQSKKK